MSDDLIKQWDEYVESMGSVMGDVEHMAQQMRDRIEQLNERLTAATDDAKEAEAYAEQLEAKLTKAVETLREFAKQKRTTEMDVDEYDQADIEGAYCQFIFKARATLAKLKEKE